MIRDFRYAIRVLRQNPGFAMTAIISIALAIGANSAIFAMADGIMLRPLQSRIRREWRCSTASAAFSGPAAFCL